MSSINRHELGIVDNPADGEFLTFQRLLRSIRIKCYLLFNLRICNDNTRLLLWLRMSDPYSPKPMSIIQSSVLAGRDENSSYTFYSFASRRVAHHSHHPAKVQAVVFRH